MVIIYHPPLSLKLKPVDVFVGLSIKTIESKRDSEGQRDAQGVEGREIELKKGFVFDFFCCLFVCLF